MASIIQIGAKWRAQVRRRGYPTQTKTFPTKGAAERWARQVESAIDLGNFQDTKSLDTITLKDLIDRYRLEQTRSIGRSKSHCLDQIVRRAGDVPLTKLTTDRIIAYAQNRGAGPVTWSMEFAYLRKILRIARSVWKIPFEGDPVADARAALDLLGLSGRSKERNRRPTQEELDALIDYFRARPRQTVPMWDIIPFAVATAMRLGEIVSLRWDDLDRNKRTVIIRDRKDPKQKLGNHQVVPLLPTAWEVIERQPEDSTPDARIFPYSADTISSIFPRACKEIGIVDLRFHDLRHEGTSRLFEAGYQIQEVAVFTGHRNWNMLRRYTQIKPESLHREPLPTITQ